MMTAAPSRILRLHRPLRFSAGLLLSLSLLGVSCTGVKASQRKPLGATAPKASAPRSKPAEKGVASIYTDRRTASGERFKSAALCAAHRTLPLGSLAKVTHKISGKSVVVRINDRGPFKKGRIIDLTPAAASAIGLTWKSGIAQVEVQPVTP